jgi:hypothetical protein
MIYDGDRLPGGGGDFVIPTLDLDALLPANWAAANRAAHPVTKSERWQAA